MFKHSLLLIYRNFLRFKSTFFINLLGLSTGLACTLLIYLWVRDEWNVDKFHEKGGRILQAMLRSETANGIGVGTGMAPILAKTMAAEFPEVEYAVSEGFNPEYKMLTVGEKVLKAKGLYAEKDYFQVFSYGLTQGDKSQVLADDNSIVISEELARKLFNTTDNVVGKTLEFGNKEQLVVSGLFNLPPNSSKQFDFILPYGLMFKQNPNVRNDWSNNWPDTYVVLKEGTNEAQFSSKIKDLIKSHTDQENVTLFVRPYEDAYLFDKYENGIQAGGRIEYVKLFSVIAIFILLIACTNFMNLSTAKASRRLKEVGIKKVIGAHRSTLVLQYLGESLLMAFLSLLTAGILVELVLPHFNDITGKELEFTFDGPLILFILGITLFTGLIAGSYPALYLSGFKPVAVLKGKLNASLGEVWARKGLVVFQFTISIILIVAVLVVYKQIEFIQTQNAGYDKENVMVFEMEGKVKEHLETYLAEAKNIPGVTNASSIWRGLFGGLNSTSDFSWEGKDPNYVVDMEYRRVNYDLIELLDIQMKEGRPYSREYSADSSKIIFNEAAIEKMGIQDPIGKRINLWGRDHEIIGVAKNFHFESVHENVKPLFFYLKPARTNTILLKIDSKDLSGTIRKIQEFHEKFTQAPLDFKFLDEDFQQQYLAEKRVAILSRYFAGLAILISCLGLFGLAAFTAERRVKEIGVRKVLGASSLNIILLLSGDFTKLVLLAICVALPVSFLLVQNWLDNFAYSIGLEWWLFVGAGVLTLLIALITVSFQAVKAALRNPVKSLRSE